MNQIAGLFERAQKLHEKGLLKQAEPLYLAFLKEQPNHEEALFWLASLYTNLGQHQSAIDYYYRALEQNPDALETHTGLGMAFNALGQPSEAETSFRRAIGIDASVAELHYYLGSALFQQAKFSEAEVTFRKALELKPGFLEALINLRETMVKRGSMEEANQMEVQIAALQPARKNLHAEQRASLKSAGAKAKSGRAITAGSYIAEGDKLMNAKRFAQAAASFRQAVALDANSYQAHNGLAAALMHMERHMEAVPHFDRALTLKPDLEPALVNAGNTLLLLREMNHSIDCFRRALAITHKPLNLVNLGGALVITRQYGEAKELLREAIRLNPSFAGAYLNLSIALMETGELEEAFEFAQKSLTHSPRELENYFLLNSLNQRRRTEAESLKALKRLLALDPKNARAHGEMGMLQLMLGNFDIGWKEYNSTYTMSGSSLRRFSKPEWKGEIRPEATLLLHIDQGVGDCIQFMRYLNAARKRVGRIVVECREVTAPIFEDFPDIDEVVMRPENGSMPKVEFDFHLTTTYLPGLFWEEAGPATERVPYMKADEALVQRWQERLRDIQGFKVGLVWAGNKDYVNDHLRSTQLSTFAPLATVPGVQLFSLQKGSPAGEAKTPPDGMNLIDLADEINDFKDTAAAIAALDLVISVDTSVAHLAGAIARPVWTALPYVHEWRWLREKSDTHWYPTMRLFRQETFNDWSGMMKTIAEELKRHVGGQ